MHPGRMLGNMSSSIRWREHAAVILLNLTVLGVFASRLADPRVDAVMIEPPPTLTPAPVPTKAVLHVYVSGAVARPGVVDLPEGARVSDALRGVGGFSGEAARDHVNLASPLGDGQQVHVPRRDEVAGRPPDGFVPGGVGGISMGAVGGVGVFGAGDSGAGVGGAGIASIGGAVAGAGSLNTTGGGAAGAVPEVSGLIDINRADAAALDVLPGVGPALAARIVAHRDAHGPFASVEGLVDVAGIGPKTLERMRGMIVVR